MKALFVSAISALGALLAATATSGCAIVFVDEPTMPKSMIEKKLKKIVMKLIHNYFLFLILTVKSVT